MKTCFHVSNKQKWSVKSFYKYFDNFLESTHCELNWANSNNNVEWSICNLFSGFPVYIIYSMKIFVCTHKLRLLCEIYNFIYCLFFFWHNIILWWSFSDIIIIWVNSAELLLDSYDFIAYRHNIKENFMRFFWVRS